MGKQGIEELVTALVAASKEFEKIERNKEAYKYSYAPLEVVKCATEPALTKHGLRIIQLPCNQEGRVGVETILVHTSGQHLARQFAVDLPKSDPQSIGTALTYFRRYGWLAVLGLAPEDEDDDAQSYTQERKKPDDPGQWRLMFGKHKGKLISEFDRNELISYCKWLADQTFEGGMERSRLITIECAREFLGKK